MFGEAADGLGVFVLFDGEVVAREAGDGLAFVVGDEDVDDGLARVDVDGGSDLLGGIGLVEAGSGEVGFDLGLGLR